MLPLMPILPKSNWEFRFPPKCPLENINFIQLRKFVSIKEEMYAMGPGYDLVEEECRARKKRL